MPDAPKIEKIRFAVGTDAEALSSVWFVTVANAGDVYVGTRSLGGTLKASFHKDGNCHVRFGPSEKIQPLTNTYMSKWKRKPAPPTGVSLAASLFFPTDLLRGRAPLPEEKAFRMLFKPAAAGSAVEIGLFYSRQHPNELEERLLKVGKPLIYSDLNNGEFFSLVARTVPFNAEGIPQVSGLAKGQAQTYPPAVWTSESFKPGDTRENLSMMLFNDSSASGVLQVVQISGIRLTHNAHSTT
jgi:hypothetical protein